MIERFDFAFSYWILLWYGLYELRIIQYNPKFALIIAIMENLLSVVWMVYYSYAYLGTFILINVFIKVIPLYRLTPTTYTRQDVYATVALFGVYSGWMWINQTSFPELFMKNMEYIKEDSPVGPMMHLIHFAKT